MKRCPKCQSEYEGQHKFCPKDGTMLEEKESGPLVSAKKILSAGDVNITNTTNNNITNINQQDDSKKVMTCVVSGRQDLATQGAVCGKCGKWAYKEFFDFAKSECSSCKDIQEESNEKIYRENFLNFIKDDSKIDSKERLNLESLGKKLGLASGKISQIEKEIRMEIESTFLKLRSHEEEVRINKGKEALFIEHNFEEAFSEFNDLRESLPHDSEVLDLCIWAATAEKPSFALECLETSSLANIDSPEKSFYLINVYEALGEDSDATEELKKGLFLFPDNQRLQLKQVERLIDLYFDHEQEAEQLENLQKYYENDDDQFSCGEDLYSKFVNSYYKVALDTGFENFSEFEKISGNYHFVIKSNAFDIRKKFEIAGERRRKEEEERIEKKLLEEEKRKIAEEMLLLCLVKRRIAEEQRLAEEERRRIAEEECLAEEEKRREEEEKGEKAARLVKEKEQRRIDAEKTKKFYTNVFIFLSMVGWPLLGCFLLWDEHAAVCGIVGFVAWLYYIITSKVLFRNTFIFLSSAFLLYSFIQSVPTAPGSELYDIENPKVSYPASPKPEKPKRDTINYQNGDRYVGEINSNRQEHGKGKLFYANGDSFTGIFKNDERYRGTQLYGGGDSFKGEFKNNLKLDGIYRWKNGNSFEGLWKNGQPHYGSYRYSDGVRYEGYFIHRENNILRHGQGNLFFSDGGRFEGEYREDEAYRGKLYYTNGNRYEGSFKGKRPVPHGQGKLYFADGKVYVGTVLNGFAEGEGRIIFQGKDYPCKWKDYNIELKRGILGRILKAPFKILGLD